MDDNSAAEVAIKTIKSKCTLIETFGYFEKST